MIGFQTGLFVLAGSALLPKGLIKGNRAGHGDVKGFDDAYLRNNEIAVGHRAYLVADTSMFIAKDQRDPGGKVHLVQGDSVAGKMGGEYMIGPSAEVTKTGSGVGVLMDSQPIGGAAAAFSTPFFMPRYPGIEDKKILHAYCVTSTHDGGNIVRIKDIFQHDGQVVLSFIKHAGDPLFSFRGHGWSGKAQK